MKILLLNQYFWPENFRINELALALKKLGHDVDVITGQPTYPHRKFFKKYKWWQLSKESWKGIVINRIPLFPRFNNRWSLVLNYLSFVVLGLFFAPFLLIRKKHDVIFVYAPSPIFQAIPASFLGWIRGVPVVIWVQDLWPESAKATGYVKSSWALKILEWLVKFTYARADLILVQSAGFIDPVLRLVPNAKVKYYPNTVDQTFLKNQGATCPPIASLRSGFTVLFAGNIGAAQSMETIVSAAKRLKCYDQIKFIIVGDGSKKDWLLEQVNKNKLTNIHYEGRLPVENMPSLLRKGSVLLVSLAKDPIFSLTVPNKIQAYLAVGRPIVACIEGEGARIINEANAGFVVSPEDPDKLANAIVDMYMMNEKDLNNLGDNGQKYFKKKFDEEVLVQDLIQIFKSL